MGSEKISDCEWRLSAIEICGHSKCPRTKGPNVNPAMATTKTMQIAAEILLTLKQTRNLNQTIQPTLPTREIDATRDKSSKQMLYI